MSRTISCLLIAGLCLLASCGGSGGGSSCESPTNLAGNWQGTTQDNLAGPGVLGVTFTQSGCELGGIWQSSFTDPNLNNSGTLSGDIEGTSVSADLAPSDPATCAYFVIGTLAGNNSISGNFTTTNCPSNGGTFTIVRQ